MKNQIPKTTLEDAQNGRAGNCHELWQSLSGRKSRKEATILTRAKSSIENMKADYFFKAATIGDEAYRVRRHLTNGTRSSLCLSPAWSFSLSAHRWEPSFVKADWGCRSSFRLLFIFYYIIDNIGFKMARDGVWEAWQGMWLSSAILAPLGIFLTYKAVNDSVILNADTYLNALKNLFGKTFGQKSWNERGDHVQSGLRANHSPPETVGRRKQCLLSRHLNDGQTIFSSGNREVVTIRPNN